MADCMVHGQSDPGNCPGCEKERPALEQKRLDEQRQAWYEAEQKRLANKKLK